MYPYRDEELYRMGLQAEFLAVVAEIEPKVCGDLAAHPFAIYKQLEPKQIPVRWNGYVRDRHCDKVQHFHSALEDWARKWNLTEERSRPQLYTTLQSGSTFSPNPQAHCGSAEL